MFDPYEGNEPYIFVSYSRKDIEMVLPILESLSDVGYRLWRDENGIPPGVKWDEIIAGKIKGSAVVLALFSKNYKESVHCMNELRRSYTQKKIVLPVYLEDVSFGDGDELYIKGSRIQSIRYAGPVDLVTRIQKNQDLDRCKRDMDGTDIHAAKDSLKEEKAQRNVAQNSSKKYPSRPFRAIYEMILAFAVCALVCLCMIEFLGIFEYDEGSLIADLRDIIKVIPGIAFLLFVLFALEEYDDMSGPWLYIFWEKEGELVIETGPSEFRELFLFFSNFSYNDKGEMGEITSTTIPFFARRKVVSIIVASNIGKIRDGAFFHCTNLKSIELSETTKFDPNFLPPHVKVNYRKDA